MSQDATTATQAAKILRAALKRKAEKMDWKWCDDDDGSVELETWSPAGEDIIVDLEGKDLVREMREYAANFDVDEHVEPLVEMRGKRGVPSSARVLVEDAEEIQNMLDELSDAFDRIAAVPAKNIFEAVVCPNCGQEVVAEVMVVGGVPVRMCPNCGTIHETHRWYKEVSEEKMNSIIETREPRGLFLHDTGIEVIGVDNSTGDAWTEEFPDRVECLLWLLRENDDE